LTNCFSIASNNITGSIPDEIQHLSKLDLLNLEQNALTGSIPASLNKLILLEYLDLNFNRLTGSIPSWLGTSLGSLKVLGLGHNSLYGSIPETLSSGELSTNLKTLALDNNMLSGDALTIQRLKNLEYLYLSNNDLSGQLEHGLLSDMPSLIEVDLSHNRFSGAIPYHLFLTQSLRVLDLGSNKFSGSLPSRTGTIQNVLLDQSKMEFLSLRNNSISSTIPDSLLGHLSSLTYLDLSINVLDGTYPRTLGGLNGLTCLLLGNNSFDAGPVPEILQSLTNLEELSLDSLQLEGALPTWLQDFGRLKLLDLSKNRLIGSISLDFEALPDLTFLMLHDNLLTGSLPGSIGSLQNLIVLSIHDNNVTGDVGILCADDTSLEVVTIDCNVTVCPCCTSCCDSDDCFKDYEWDTLKHNDGAWEEDFQRAEYAFNPMIITTAGKH
jgi:Leucine-rich repeat (LRR) protein